MGLEFNALPATRAAGRPFSDAVKVSGEVLCLAGRIGTRSDGKLAPGGIAAETEQMMENIAGVLKANGRSFDDVFKCTVMLADIREWAAFNAVYLRYFKPDCLPARSAFGVNGLAGGAAVEMECWAWAGAK